MCRHTGCWITLEVRAEQDDSENAWVVMSGRVTADRNGVMCMMIGGVLEVVPAPGYQFRNPVVTESGQRSRSQSPEQGEGHTGFEAVLQAAADERLTLRNEARGIAAEAAEQRGMLRDEAAARELQAQEHRDRMRQENFEANAEARQQRGQLRDEALEQASEAAAQRSLMRSEHSEASMAAANDRAALRSEAQRLAETARQERCAMRDESILREQRAESQRKAMADEQRLLLQGMQEIMVSIRAMRSSPAPARPLSVPPPMPVLHAAPMVAPTAPRPKSPSSDLVEEMRKSRGCVEEAHTSDIEGAGCLAGLPVVYRWRSDDTQAPEIRAAIRSLAAMVTNITRDGVESFAAGLRQRLELAGQTATLEQAASMQLLAGSALVVAMAEFAVGMTPTTGRKAVEHLQFARVTPAPSSKGEAAHWRGGATIPSLPLPSRATRAQAVARDPQPRRVPPSRGPFDPRNAKPVQ